MTFQTRTPPGPNEARLRQRLAEMRVGGLRTIRITCAPEANGLTHEERCAAILAALDAPIVTMDCGASRAAA